MLLMAWKGFHTKALMRMIRRTLVSIANHSNNSILGALHIYLKVKKDLYTEQSVLSIERVMKSSYYDLLDKYFGEFCGDGDAVDVVDEKVMDLALT